MQAFAVIGRWKQEKDSQRVIARRLDLLAPQLANDPQAPPPEMYEHHFHFSERPFAAAPLTASYVPGANFEHARQSLVRCVERAEGVGLAIGAAGTGKSLLCQLLADYLRQRKFQVALLASARLHTRRSLLQNILFELNLPYRDMEDEELRLSLVDHLSPRGGSQGGLVLIVDEAHTLPLRLLEEIRLISNFTRDGQMRVRLVLVGSPAMEERLANPKLESLAQRIAVRAYLQPLSREETCAYVREQIQRVGGNPDEIAPQGVLASIHHATDGIPRLINQVCDHALILAAIDGQARLSERGIEQAWADLQQLPAPWHESAKSEVAAHGGAIEFGQLGDEPAGSEVTLELPAGDALGNQALAELDQIDQTIHAIGEAPLAPTDSEEELVLQSAHNPFGGGFDEEEVIIDRYASLEARAIPDRARVASVEGKILGQALRSRDAVPSALEVESVLPHPKQECPAMRVVEPAVEEVDEPQPTECAEQFDPAADPVLPELVEMPPEEFQPLPLHGTAGDDRDLIVVDNARPRSRQLVVAPLQRRRQYRQLFSSLRRE